jgi:hypothetical protein
MNELIKMLLPAMVIMSFFSIVWTIKYPAEHREALAFKLDDGAMGFFISFTVVLFDVGFIATVIYGCSFIP